MRHILSATQTYNYALAKWLHTKLKPLSLNRYTVTDIFEWANEILCNLEIANGDILVSYELRTMLDRAHRLSSSWTHFSDECDRLKTVFTRLKFPKHLVNSTIKSFVDSKVCDQQQPLSSSQQTDHTIRVVLPFKDQISADISLKVNTTIQPVFVSRKIEQELSVKETKPPIVNQQCVVYSFQCDLCDAGYAGYTRGHLRSRVKGP